MYPMLVLNRIEEPTIERPQPGAVLPTGPGGTRRTEWNDVPKRSRWPFARRERPVF
jgi:hypothetical protein